MAPARPVAPVSTAKAGKAARSTSAPAPKAAVGKRAAALGRRALKRPPGELVKITDRLGDYIENNPGQRMEIIGKALGMPTRELNLPVKKLLAARKIRTEGHKRATEYFPA